MGGSREEMMAAPARQHALLAIGLVCMVFGACRRQLPQTSTPNFTFLETQRNWRPDQTLAAALVNGVSLFQICVHYAESTAPSASEAAWSQAYARVVENAVLQWAHATAEGHNARANVTQGGCAPAPAQGVIEVRLFRSERNFQDVVFGGSRISTLAGANPGVLNICKACLDARGAGKRELLALHEVGHLFGLDHSERSTSIMRANTDNAIGRTTLGSDDQEGIRAFVASVRQRLAPVQQQQQAPGHSGCASAWEPWSPYWNIIYEVSPAPTDDAARLTLSVRARKTADGSESSWGVYDLTAQGTGVWAFGNKFRIERNPDQSFRLTHQRSPDAPLSATLRCT